MPAQRTAGHKLCARRLRVPCSVCRSCCCWLTHLHRLWCVRAASHGSNASIASALCADCAACRHGAVPRMLRPHGARLQCRYSKLYADVNAMQQHAAGARHFEGYRKCSQTQKAACCTAQRRMSSWRVKGAFHGVWCASRDRCQLACWLYLCNVVAGTDRKQRKHMDMLQPARAHDSVLHSGCCLWTAPKQL